MHLDFYYEEGTNAACDNFICCRADSGVANDPSNAAGPWGSYLCDLPHKVLVHFLQFAKNEIKPDMLLWTGDNSAHNVWSNSN